MKRAKNYKKLVEATKKVTDLKSYLSSVCSTNPYKFDQSIELKIAVKRNTKNPTPYKVAVTYPNSFGKATRVLVLGEAEDAKIALQAGADYAGLEEYVTKITEQNWFEFDVVIATAGVMPKVAKLGRVLGTKGLMPNPKTGTVVTDVKSAVEQFKAGKKNFKEDKSGVINVVAGKVSMTPEQVIENIKSLSEAIKESSQTLVNDVVSIYIKTTMGPALKVTVNELFG